MRQGLQLEVDHKIANEVWSTVQLFLSEWLSECCTEAYYLEYTPDQYSIMFDSPEDALLAKLKGIPPSLIKYVKFTEDK